MLPTAMRCAIQRVSEASVTVDDELVASIGPGLVALVGVATDDTAQDASTLARKLAELRIFADADDRMNLSVADISGQVLVVSQFTLLANASKGRRPSFTHAAPAGVAEPLVARVAQELTELGVAVLTGRFGAMMEVRLVNDGPVTIVLDVTDGRVR